MDTTAKISNTKNIKPFLKWAGGKTQLLEKFENFYPEKLKSGKIKNYFEPFLGSGAVFLNLASRYNFENISLSDINPGIIAVFRVIRNNVNDLINELYKLQTLYFAGNEGQRNVFYYEVRSSFNKKITNAGNYSNHKLKIKLSAELIFLNRTCYNGLFRTNKDGQFNVPVGKYKNPQILNENNLREVNNLLSNVNINTASYKEALSRIPPNSFIYLDPPYLPLSKTSGFTQYTKFNFTYEDQTELAKIFTALSGRKDIWLMLSNSDPQNTDPQNNFFEKNYLDGNNKARINTVLAKRMINCNGNKRGKIKELIITNY